MHRLTFGCIAILAALCSSHFDSSAQTTAVDVMPMAIGNEWTYNYHYVYSWDGADGYYQMDGIVRFIIGDSISTRDSTRWKFQQFRTLTKTGTGGGSIPVIDSAYFEIVERHEDTHHLYRNDAKTTDLNPSVFPWAPYLIDTCEIDRYAFVDTSGSTTFRTHTPGEFRARSIFVLTFRRGIGQQHIRISTGPSVVGPSWLGDHSLIKAIITEVPEQHADIIPVRMKLEQNYPNPFNPMTMITFSLERSSHVTLSVFNLLGQRITILVDAMVGAGSHTVHWNATSLPSGVYLYRLERAQTVLTHTAILLK